MATASPEFTGEQIFPYTGGTAQGQTVNSASSYIIASSVPGSGAVTVTANLYQTNQPDTAFQLYPALDNGSPVAAGDVFGTDGSGSGAGSLVLTGLASGSHILNMDINSAPFAGEGSTMYHLTTHVTFTC